MGEENCKGFEVTFVPGFRIKNNQPALFIPAQSER
jgi:hypothetical protein